MRITVAALVGGKRLPIGRYRDPKVADAVAQSWARWSGCRAAIVTPTDGPPILITRNVALVSVCAPEPPAA